MNILDSTLVSLLSANSCCKQLNFINFIEKIYREYYILLSGKRQAKLMLNSHDKNHKKLLTKIPNKPAAENPREQ